MTLPEKSVENPQIEFIDPMKADIKYHKMAARKNQFARLLAAENLTIIYKKIHTAMFDPESRTIVFPLMRDLPEYVIDLFMSHEVGHALYTPCEGVHDAIKEDHGPELAGFINISEDIRIERFMKAKYPGLQPRYVKGYKWLIERGFFSENAKQTATLEKMMFADRLNIWAKIGDIVPQTFTKPKEIEFIERSKTLQTWEDSLQFAIDLFNYCRDETNQIEMNTDVLYIEDNSADGENGEDESEKGGSSQNSSDEAEVSKSDAGKNVQPMDENKKDAGKAFVKSDADTDGDKKDEKKTDGHLTKSEGHNRSETKLPVSETDSTFRYNEKLLLDDTVTHETVGYINFVPFDINEVILTHNEIVEITSTAFVNTGRKYIEYAEKLMEGTKDSVNKLVQGFERHKAADEWKRTFLNKRGSLDTSKLHRMPISDDIFLRQAIVREGKNHGLVLYLDWSSSMIDILHDTAKQLAILVQFCRASGIAYDVYAFSDGFHKDSRRNPIGSFEYDILLQENFKLFELFSSQMSHTQHVRAMNIFSSMVDDMLNRKYSYRNVGLGVYGTPLGEAVFTIPEAVRRLRTNADNVQIVNVIFLTDGVASELPVHSSNTYNNSANMGHVETLIVNDKTSGKSSVIDNSAGKLKIFGCVHAISKLMELNSVNFHLITRGGYNHNIEEHFNTYGEHFDLKTHGKEIENTGCTMIAPENSFNSIYFLQTNFYKSVMDQDTDDIDLEKRAQFNNNFRAILDHFINMICK